MGLLRNIEVSNNQTPRVCNFDITDYYDEGVVGYGCSGITVDLKTQINFANSYTTARATRDAWFNSVKDYFLATYGWFYDDSFEDFAYNNNCISLEKRQAILDSFFGPTGFLEKYKLFVIKSAQWWNCLLYPIHKQTGIVTDSLNMLTYYRDPDANVNPIIDYVWNYEVDYTNYQEPSRAKYYEFRKVMGDMMQALKQMMIITGGHTFTKL